MTHFASQIAQNARLRLRQTPDDPGKSSALKTMNAISRIGGYRAQFRAQRSSQ
jgi:hypothetical protein